MISRKQNALNLLCYISLLGLIGLFLTKVTRDREIIDQQANTIHRQYVDNTNLDYQLKQCKLLYIGNQ